ncbi:MAG: hypothetical protein PHD65_07280 [Gallionella sp.]|nr:hypothetical protein [Gallionella sp.]
MACLLILLFPPANLIINTVNGSDSAAFHVWFGTTMFFIVMFVFSVAFAIGTASVFESSPVIIRVTPV